MQNARNLVQIKKERESLIFDAACRIIKEKGFHQARITDIAQTAGISYGLVYHYFKSKADLFDAILNEWWNGLFSRMDQINTEHAEIEDKLGVVIGYFLDQYERRPDLVHIFITEISRSASNLTHDRLRWFKLFMDRTEAMIESAQSSGKIRSDVRARYLTYIFLGALESFITAMVLENQHLKGQSQKNRIAEALLEVFMSGAKSAS
jgi:AcrR family transcriptional regulator